MGGVKSKTKNKYQAKLIAKLGLGLMVAVLGISAVTPVLAQTIEDLNQQIDEKRRRLSTLEEEKGKVEGQLSVQESEVSTVTGQLAVVENGINIATLNVSKTETELEKTQLELQQTEERIKQKEELIGARQQELAELIRTVYREHNRSNLEIILGDQTFAEFFSSLKYVTTLEVKAKEEINRLTVLKHELAVQRENLIGKHDELKQHHVKLKQQQVSLVQQQAYQEELIEQLRLETGESQNLLNQIQQEINIIQANARGLECEILKQLYGDADFSCEFGGTFMWPVASRRINSYFRDPSYPYRAFFEHTGIDIDADQGTPVVASADGTVYSVTYPTSPSLSSITIQHGDEFQTRYLHMSRVNVSPNEIVRQGQVIGLSGGARGSFGAGIFTTGDHLHYEIKRFCGSVDGYPLFCVVDPLDYLP